MRIYRTFPDALNELKRDIAELGRKVHPQTMQDKQIADDPDYETMEYPNMVYTVTHPSLSDLEPFVKTLEWCKAEFQERMRGTAPDDYSNPNAAWRLRPEVWSEFAGHFGYTYGERYSDGRPGRLLSIAEELQKHPDTRQAFLPVFDGRDPARLGEIRVPCTLGYWFNIRDGQLNVTYLQRSGDYFTHLANDLWLTHALQLELARWLDIPAGTFTHWIGSLHVYKKDVADVF